MPNSHGQVAVVAADLAADHESPLASRSDDELMLMARDGAGAAFEALVRRHQARVLRVAARQLGRGGPAADAAQNTFMEIYRCLPRYRPCGVFRAYLYRVLLNQCRMIQRSARSEAARLRVIEPAVEARESVEAHIVARERERDLEVALGRLSGKLRDVVLLRYSAGLGYEEIAATLALPIGTVKRRLFDAMEKLRQLVGDA